MLSKNGNQEWRRQSGGDRLWRGGLWSGVYAPDGPPLAGDDRDSGGGPDFVPEAIDRGR